MNSFIQHHRYEQLAEEDLNVQYKLFYGVGVKKKSHNQTQTKQKPNNKKTTNKTNTNTTNKTPNNQKTQPPKQPKPHLRDYQSVK